MLANATSATVAETAAPYAILPKRVQAFGQGLGIVWRDEQATAGLLHDLRERATARLHNRHAACHRLQQEHTLGLVVRRGDREHVERSKEIELALSIQFTSVGELVAEPDAPQRLSDFLEVAFVGATKVTSDLESDRKSVV